MHPHHNGVLPMRACLCSASRSLFIFLGLAALFCAPVTAQESAPAEAQTPAKADEQVYAEPNEAQLQLYETASKSFADQDYGRAIELLRSALALGELNLLYLNLGRAYFRNKECGKADEAYKKALTAPSLRDPSPEQVAKTIAEYRTEFNKGCPGRVVVACNPADMKISVDGANEQNCGPLTLPAGSHRIVGRYLDKTTQQAVTVTANQDTSLTLTIDVPKAVVSQVPQDTGSSLGLIGLITGGVGVALLGTAVLLDVVVLDKSISEFEEAVREDDINRLQLKTDAENLQTTTLATYSAGIALTGLGVILYLLAPNDSSNPETNTTAVLPWLTPDSAGLHGTYRF